MRNPFLPLPYEYKNLAIPKELMVDYENGILYIKGRENESDIQLGQSSINVHVQNQINQLLDGVTPDGNTLRKLRSLIKSIEDWKLSMTSEDGNNLVDNLLDIIKKFEGIGSDSPTLLELLNLKIDKVEGKDLSTNDFTDELLNKLNGIDYGANKYTHPTTKQCGYVAPISSVNGRTGNVVLTKQDIGLGNIDPNANYYVHPSEKQCTAPVVTSVNSKSGSVVLNKNDIGLNMIQNYEIATEANMSDGNEKYVTPEFFSFLLNRYVSGNNTHTKDFFKVVSLSNIYPYGFSGDGSYLMSKLDHILVNLGDISNNKSSKYVEFSTTAWNRNTNPNPTFPSGINILDFSIETSLYFALYCNTIQQSNALTFTIDNEDDWELETLTTTCRVYAKVSGPLDCVVTIKLNGNLLKKVRITHV